MRHLRHLSDSNSLSCVSLSDLGPALCVLPLRDPAGRFSPIDKLLTEGQEGCLHFDHARYLGESNTPPPAFV